MTPNKIILHHSLSRDSGTVSWGAIRRYHVDTLGWAAIGYHAGIELVGDTYETLIGRMWNEPGAHTRGHNMDSLGLCLVGNFDEDYPPLAQLHAAARIVKYWMRLYTLTAIDVYGHNDFASYKTCPGTKFDMVTFRRMLMED